MYILYKDNNKGFTQDQIKSIISGIEGWKLGNISNEFVNDFDWSYHRAIEVSEDMAWGALFSSCTERPGKGVPHLKYYPADLGQNALDNQSAIEATVWAESENSSDAVRYDITAADETKAVAWSKLFMSTVIKDIFDGRLTKINITENELERISWDAQRNEAEAYLIDNTVATPVLNTLSATRNITKADLVDKIMTRITSFNSQVALLLSQQQTTLDTLNACVTIDDCLIAKEDLFGVMTIAHLAYRRGRLTSDEIVDEENYIYNRVIPFEKYGIQF